MGWLATLMVAIAALALLGLGLRFVENLELENRAVESQLRAARLYDKALEERVKEMQRFRHDINGLLQAIEYSQYLQRNGETEPAFKGASTLINSTLKLAKQQCAEANIDFSCDIDESFIAKANGLEIEESDIYAVVRNLIENALEASMEIQPASDRFIFTRLSAQENGLAIEVSNRIAKNEMPTFETTKEDVHQHGIGLQIVNDIATRHGGDARPSLDAATRTLSMHVQLGKKVK